MIWFIGCSTFCTLIDSFVAFSELWGLFTGACRSLCSRNGPLTLQWGPELWGRPQWHCFGVFYNPSQVYRSVFQLSKVLLFMCSGFVFLRLICPAILNPRMFNIISGEYRAYIKGASLLQDTGCQVLPSVIKKIQVACYCRVFFMWVVL